MDEAFPAVGLTMADLADKLPFPIDKNGQAKTSTGSPVRNLWQVSIGLRYSF